MVTLATPVLSSSFLPSLNPRFAKHSFNPHNRAIPNQRRIGSGTCRAELGSDAPFAVAIGACILNSLVFPVNGASPDDESDSTLDSTDARFGVMGIISFIPYFNWLSWVFAWLDTGKRRYAIYALVYLAPYLRTNLSLSPEESWLPIASIIFCIIHIQLEVSISNGDLKQFQIFGDSAKELSSRTRKRDDSNGDEGSYEGGRKSEDMNLPSAEEESRNEIRRWGLPKKPLDDNERLDGDWDDNQRGKH